MDAGDLNSTLEPQRWLLIVNGTFWEDFYSEMSLTTILISLFCLVLLIIVIVTVLLHRIRQTYRRWKQRSVGTTNQASISRENSSSKEITEKGGKRNLMNCMIATLDEFESLTPLIVTPGSLSDEEPLMRRTSTGRTSSNTLQTTTTTSSAHSPPPPRRAHAGRTYLVPLTSASRGRPVPLTPVETGMEMTLSTTTKSIGTIPEAYTEESTGSTVALHQSTSNHSLTIKNKGAFCDLDIISIDRTSVSNADRASLPYGDRTRGVSNMYYNQVQTAQIPFAVQAPSYRPPPPPGGSSSEQQTSKGLPNAFSETAESSASVASSSGTNEPCAVSNVDNLSPGLLPISPTYIAAAYKSNLRFDPTRAQVHQIPKTPKESPSIDSISSNLSSPMESSVGDSGSPLDTTGSIADLSDSIYLASESDLASDPKGKAYYLETGQQKNFNNNGLNTSSDKSDSDIVGLSDNDFSSRRYQLHRIEEETEVDEHHIHLGGSKTEESLSALSREVGSVLDSECNLLIPRSASENIIKPNGRKEKEGLI